MSDYDIPPTIDDPVVSTSSTTATKPRRKRKKKKKKKKTAVSEPSIDNDSSDDNDDDGDFGIVINNKDNVNSNHKTTRNKTKTASNISTPQELLRRRLIEIDGYEATQVDQAMEDMWDKGIRYDEYDAVVHYLSQLLYMSQQFQLLQTSDGHGICGTTTACTASYSNSVLTASTQEAEEEEKDSTAMRLDDDGQLLQDGFLETTTDPTNVEETINDAQEDGKEEEQCEREDDEESAAPTPQQSVTMMMKLETVAGFENLTDAIFALGQWVKRAAKDEEIELFCRGPLPTVVRRGISSEIEDPKLFETVVKAALVRLLMAVLNRCGVVEGEAEIEETMGIMLKQARKVTLHASDERNIEDDENVIGDRVARFIVSRLAIAMDKMKEYNNHNNDKDDNDNDNDNNKNCHQEERDGSINVGNDDGNENDTAMATLLSQRDAVKAEATRACITVQNSMESMFSDTSTTTTTQDQPPATTTTSSSLENIQDIALHIVDQKTKHKLDNEKVRLETLKSQVREEGESSETVQSLVESKLSLQTKRRGYQENIAELRAALEELESQETDATLQIERLSKQIGEEEQIDDVNTKQLEQEISQAKESVRYGNLVNGLAGMMKTYGKALENATAFKTGNTTEQQTSDSDNGIGNNKTVAATAEPVTKESTSRAMENYLSKIRNYFLNEAHCATQLQHRLATKTAETTALKSEISQYNSVKSLFATQSTITAQIEASIAQNERTIQADTRRIAAITDDGRFMYDALLERLDTYSANIALEAFFPTELLKGVPAAIRALNIVVHDCDVDKLVPFVKKEEETTNETMTIQGSAPNQDCEGDGVHPSVSGSQAVDSTSSSRSTITAVAVAPKLTWASLGAKVTTPKQSLLDIQKEELDRSMENKNSIQSRDDKSNEQD